MCVMGHVEKKPCIILQLFYNGSEAEGKEHYKAFYDIGPFMAMAKEIPYEEMNGQNNMFATPHQNYYLKGVLLSDLPTRDLSRRVFDRVMQASKEDFNVAMILEYLPNDKINSIPEDATPYRRNLPGNALILVNWKEHTPEKQEAARQTTHDLATLMPDGEGYGNYGGTDEASVANDGVALPDKTQKLFGKHYPRLQALKRKYDPNMLFHKWFLIAPA